MNYIKSILHLVIIGVLSSCSNYIPLEEFESNIQGVDIIVEGFVATDFVNPIVRLTEPLKFNEIYKDKPVMGAIVTLSDGTNTVELREYSDLEGYYTTNVEFNGEIGKTYTLTIDYNNKTYKASDELVAVPKFDETRFPFERKVYDATYYNFSIPRHQFGFRVPSLSVFEYETFHDTRSKENPSITNTLSFIGERNHPEDWEKLRNPLVPFSHDKSELETFNNNVDLIYAHTDVRLDASFSFYGSVPTFNYSADEDKETYINIYQFSVSDDYYSYLLTLFADTEWAGLLSSLSGKASTNLSEGALGYFWATDIKKISYKAKDVIK